MITAAFIIEAIINLISGGWFLIHPISQLRLLIPEKYIDNNPALLMLAQWWGGMVLLETVLLCFGIFNISQRMMIYVVMLSGEFFIIPPTIQFMVREKVVSKILSMLIMLIVFAAIRIFLMYEISIGAT